MRPKSVTSPTSLFVSGGFFAYKMAFPAALKFLVEFGRQFQPMVTINEYWSLATTLILGVVGLVSGMVPAFRASRLDPIEALRHE